ncbi:response regulator transcription factor [Paenibacillus sp. 1P07SE]|uniref:response regulator transcription factor n=1 Tax=Paenibacillus sp. 1P07SE TaxID=3132209 RepID=UPI0039A6B817
MKLLIADDDPLVGQSLKLLLGKEEDLEVVGVARHGQEAIELCRRLAPDIVLMDIQMPVMDGITSTKAIKSMFPTVRVMMLTTFRDESNIRLALQAGAEGYLIKSASVDNMAAQLRALSSGTTVLDPEVLKTIISPGPEPIEGLTERETEIVDGVAQGLSNKEISEQLFLSQGTVRNMLTIILDKLELRDRTQLAIFYWQRK